MNRRKIIQTIINKIGAKSYLEIGIGNGKLHTSIQCDHKVSVDPCVSSEWGDFKASSKLLPTFKLTSDEFFKQNSSTFDVIFIDGLHIAEQVEKDIYNALRILNPKGFIICHDISPTTAQMQEVPRVQKTWTGDCWKAWVKIRSKNSNLSMYVVDTDFGCGVIQLGEQEILDINNQDLTFENLEKNRSKWLNLKDFKDWEKSQK